MALTRDDVLHLAKLCRITLTDAEVERDAVQLSSVISYIDQLQEVDVTGVDVVAHLTGLENVLRDDEVRMCSAEARERILAQFPMREGDLLKTRGVFAG
ncbi:Asp-tRNA(Asn)/Glu-tRNA(Gln) amidotransferase subunit GatC [Candidatus Uhrbacteria bacterium]|nr:Asp-tRNA(Asn)/Glu-tRNA(Gln) amidotransferase subunit GatC [Candidatus Uhrbacteria bacterium]